VNAPTHHAGSRVSAADRRVALIAIPTALTALLALWRLLPASTPPIYDGLCIADPYHLVGGTPAPTSATKTYPTGEPATDEVRTSENPAQADLLFMSGTFSTPGSSLTVSIAPVWRPAAQPAKGHIDGNVYRVDVSSAGAPVKPSQSFTLLLRATKSNRARTMERLDGSTWTPLKTFVAGCGDTFEAASTRIGDFALVVTGGGGGTQSPGSGPPVAAIAGALAVAVIAGLLVLVRLNRTRDA